MRRVLSICLLLVTLFHTVGIHGSATAVPMPAFGRAKGKLSTATATFTPVLTATTRVITYDGLQRLTGAVESPGSSFAYAYDLAGNRTGVTVNGTQTISHTYNVANQVMGWTYDQAGNLTNDGTTSYSYDALNHLTNTIAGTQANTYTYNGDGTLVGATANGTTTSYTQDLAAGQSQILAATTGLTGTDELYGQDIAPLAALTGGARTWYGLDGQGSVRQTLDDTGSVLGNQTYDPFGQIEAGSSLVAPFGYTGELQNGTTGQEYLRARWYQPGSGTLLGVDPLLTLTGQPYSYAGNDPVNGSDPSGLNSCAFYDLVCQYNAFHDAARQSSFGRGFYAGTTSLIHGIGTEAGALGNTTISCLNPFDQTNCQNQRAANAATFAYVYAHPGDAVRAALLAAVAPYACNDTAYNIGYGLPQLALSALGALGEGGDVLAGAADAAPGLADLPATDVAAAEVADNAGSITAGGTGEAGRVYRPTDELGSSQGGPTITLDQARAAAEQNGIDMRMFDLAYEDSVFGYGFSSIYRGSIMRGPTGRILMTLTNIGLRSEVDAVSTIAHELNHVRGYFRMGRFTEEIAAELAEIGATIYFKGS